MPILIGGEPYGNLYLTEKQGADEFTSEDEEVAVMLADLAGIAIDHARRYTGVEGGTSDAAAHRRGARRDDRRSRARSAARPTSA